MSDRLFAVALLLVVAGYAYLAWGIEVPFQYEPLGPKPWPLVLAAVAAICAVIILVRPAAEPKWPRGRGLLRAALLLGALILYAVLFESLGYMLTTFALCLGLSLMLGAKLWRALAFAAVVAVPGYFLFTDALQLNLPWGEVFR